MADAKLRLVLVGEDRTASKALKGVGTQAEKSTSSLASAGKALKGFLALSAVTTAIEVVGDLVEAAEGAATSNARLEQVFRSMGDASGEAAKSAEDYAEKLAMQIGVDDDIIKATQAKLATFRAVSDETARQEGIFQRATNAAADLAAAGFGSMETNAVQLGKALQDPVKGLTALAKSGVTFTAQEKAKIKALVESGNQLEAQKIILSAIESQVGGVATATANASDIQQVAIDNMKEALGQQLLPAYSEITEAIVNLTAAVGDNQSALGPYFDTLTGIAAALNDISKAASDSDSAIGFLARSINNITGMSALGDLGKMYADSSARADDAKKSVTDWSTALKLNDLTVKSDTDAIGNQNAELKKNAEHLQKVRDKRLQLMGGRIALEASFDAATKAAKENGKTLDYNTEKGRANRQALLGIANAAKQVPGQMERSRAQFIKAATAMGMSETAAKKLATKLGLIKSKKVTIDAHVQKSGITTISFAKGSAAAAPSFRVVAKRKGGYAPPGWVLRGEEGPELTRETSATQTLTASQTRSVMSGESAGVVIQNHFHVAPGANLRELGDVVDKAMRQKWQGQNRRPFEWTRR